MTEYKLEQKVKSDKAKVMREEKQKLLQLKYEKENENLKQLSVEELDNLINQIEE